MVGFINDLKNQVDSMTKELKALLGFECNLGSNDQLSATLYGGVIKEIVERPVLYTKNGKIEEAYLFRYKSGRLKKKKRNRRPPARASGLSPPLL